MPDKSNNTERALIACSVWLHLGFIGAAASAAGLLELVDGTWLSGLALIVSGGVLAAMSWRRARKVLQTAEGTWKATTIVPGEPLSRPSTDAAERPRKGKHRNACDELDDHLIRRVASNRSPRRATYAQIDRVG